MERFVISPSQIEDFQLCPLRWYNNRKKVERGPASMALLRGSAVHDAWEQFVNTPVKKRSSELLQANLSLAWNSLAEEETAKGRDLSDPKEEKSWQKGRAESRKLLEKYWEEFGQDSAVTSGESEKTLSMNFGEFDLQARLDYWILERRDIDRASVVYELKTTGRSPNQMYYTYFMPQLRYQALLASEAAPNAITEPIVYVTVLWPNGAVRLEKIVLTSELGRTYDEVYRLGKAMMQVSQMNLLQVEERAHEGYHCSWCPHFDSCRRRLGGGFADTGLDISGKYDIMVEPKEAE